MRSIIAVAVLALFAGAASAADQKLDPKFDRTTCWNWGGSGSSGQGQYISCPANIVVVTETKTEVKEVKVPAPVPVIIKEEAPKPIKG